MLRRYGFATHNLNYSHEILFDSRYNVSFDFYTNLFDCHEPTIRFYWGKSNSTTKKNTK